MACADCTIFPHRGGSLKKEPPREHVLDNTGVRIHGLSAVRPFLRVVLLAIAASWNRAHATSTLCSLSGDRADVLEALSSACWVDARPTRRPFMPRDSCLPHVPPLDQPLAFGFCRCVTRFGTVAVAPIWCAQPRLQLSPKTRSNPLTCAWFDHRRRGVAWRREDEERY